MIDIPTDHAKLISFAVDLIEKCRVSNAQRSAYYRMLNAVAETGRPDGAKAMINMMNAHLERSASHLFSPIELKFDMDFDLTHPPDVMEKGKVFAKHVTRHWERARIGRDFGRGVYESLKYGSCFMKQWCVLDTEQKPHFKHRLVMPWNFGVYREDENTLDEQEAMCETSVLTMPEVWRRICHLPNAKKLYEIIKSRAGSLAAGSQPNSFFHNVFSANVLNTGLQSATRPLPGGIVQLNTDSNYAIMGATVAAETVQFHELWVKSEDDWVTIQVVDPDILVTMFRLTNLFIKDSQQQPYNLIQPNEVSGWLWGRSELFDLIEPQQWLSSLTDDARRLMGLQIDKLLGIAGETGMTDELYAAGRNAGFFNLGQNTKIEDLTPKFPQEMLPMIKFCLEQINTLGSFPEIMQGKGEPGVRAGNHASTLLKTASPTLRDRSLIVEQQCEECADKTAVLMEAKDSNHYWVKADTPTDVENTKFILASLPPDWRITVDSHSSSPIFMEENGQEIWLAAKSGFVDGEYVLDNRPFPNREQAKVALKAREKAKKEQMEQMLQRFPEAGEKIAIKQFSPSRR
jgi:hypothetical protein